MTGEVIWREKKKVTTPLLWLGDPIIEKPLKTQLLSTTSLQRYMRTDSARTNLTPKFKNSDWRVKSDVSIVGVDLGTGNSKKALASTAIKRAHVLSARFLVKQCRVLNHEFHAGNYVLIF